MINQDLLFGHERSHYCLLLLLLYFALVALLALLAVVALPVLLILIFVFNSTRILLFPESPSL